MLWVISANVWLSAEPLWSNNFEFALAKSEFSQNNIKILLLTTSRNFADSPYQSEEFITSSEHKLIQLFDRTCGGGPRHYNFLLQ